MSTSSALDERTAGTAVAAPSDPTAPAWARLDPAITLTTAAAAAMVVALVVARPTGLWLDEAQSVVIARMPFGELFDALRHDGAPPLYYVLLHGWMQVFGDGDIAVRALSAVCAVAAVPFTVRAGGRTTGIVLVSLPFFYRYGTEARMYALLFLLVAVGWWALTRDRPVVLAVVVGLLLLTHYWAPFLVVPVLLLKRRTALALAAGSLAFLPWLPSFLYQAAHTGAPWARPADFGVFERSLRGFTGGTNRLTFQGIVTFALVVLAVRHSARARRLALVVVVPLALGMAVSAATDSAFAERYAAIVLVPFAALVARGFAHAGRPRTARMLLVAFVVLGAVASFGAVHRPRTQAPAIAAALDRHASPADIVVFCPDQLGPAVTRLLHVDVATSAYPAGDSGRIVDWVDYADRNRAGDPVEFARVTDGGAAGRTVWLVASPGYRTFGRSCTRLVEELRRLRPGDERLVRLERSSYEHASLWRFLPQEP